MRMLAIGLAIAVIVFVVTAGHVLFPALAVPSPWPVLVRPSPTARDEPPRPGDAVMFLPRLFRPFGPLGLAFMAYRLWRRLPAQRKAEVKERLRRLTRLVSPSGDLPR